MLCKTPVSETFLQSDFSKIQYFIFPKFLNVNNMLFHIFLFSLFYKDTITINSDALLVSVESFGFEKGGISSTRFTNGVESKTLYFAAFNSDEQKKFLKLRYPNNNATFICQNKDKYKIFENVNEKGGVIEFTVEENMTYYYKVIECGNVDKLKCKFLNIFTNPSTHLDIRWVGIIKAKTINLIVFGSILGLWFINWFRHFKVQIWIHYLFTLTFIFAVLLDVTRLFELKELDKKDVSLFLTSVRVIVEIIGAVIAFTTLLLASKGWCIIRDEISLKEMILSIFYSVAFFVLITLPQYFYLGVLELPVFLCSLLFVALYVRDLIVSINNASYQIMAHMLAISNEGIDPQTTPVYQKHLMYQYFEYAVIGACTLVLIKICISLFIELKLWVDETLSDIIEIIMLVAVFLIFRLREETAAGYTTIDTDEEFQLSDIESIRSSNFGKGGRKWEEGMALPAMPKIIRNRTIRDEEQPNETQQNPTVVLVSPDGTENINVRIEKEDNDE